MLQEIEPTSHIKFLGITNDGKDNMIIGIVPSKVINDFIFKIICSEYNCRPVRKPTFVWAGRNRIRTFLGPVEIPEGMSPVVLEQKPPDVNASLGTLGVLRYHLTRNSLAMSSPCVVVERV